MPGDLDQRFDAAMDRLTRAGGLLAAAGAPGRAVPVALPATLPGFFQAFCAMHGGEEAVVAEDERLSFAAIDAAADRLALALIAGWGVRQGDRVALAMRNAPAWIVCYMAVLKAGGIATLINGWWQRDELAHALALTRPALVLADAERARRVAAADPAARTVVLPVERPLDRALAPLMEQSGETTPPPVAPDDDATILFTSGSTGAAKGAVSTHRAVTAAVYNFMAHTIALRDVLVEAGTPPLHAPATLVGVPLFHVTGAVAVMLNSIAIGRKMVLMRKWDAGDALRLVAAERVTYFVGVPTMGLELMQHPDRARYDATSLSEIVAGGAPRPVTHVERLRKAFPAGNPMIGYGLTETNAVGCTNMRQSYLAKPASTGRVQQPFVALAIVDARGARLPRGMRGEIAILSAANVRGYWQDAAATAAALTPEGYVRTGDIGYLDDDGYLFIVDRAKDIIIRGGENISCQEVEASLYAHPAVAEACVFGLADERLGETPVAVVHLEPAGAADAGDLGDFLAGRLARFKLPSRIWLADAPLPKLGTGKIDKAGLRAAYGLHALEPSG